MSPRCPDCDVVMQVGVLLDHADGNHKLQPRWIGGPIERSFWQNGITTKDRPSFDVLTYRCARCGLLRSYATEPSVERLV